MSELKSINDVAKSLYERQLKWRGMTPGGNVPPFEGLRDPVKNFWVAEATATVKDIGLEVQGGVISVKKDD